MMPVSGDPLAGLRPLHTPPPVFWWPPAPGWWLVGGLGLLVMVWVGFRYRRARVQRAALAELAAIGRTASSPEAHVAELAALLKRYALYCFPGSGIATLTGEAWLRFLDEHGGKGGFTAEVGRALGSDLFRPGAEVDRQALQDVVRRWIAANRRRS